MALKLENAETELAQLQEQVCFRLGVVFEDHAVASSKQRKTQRQQATRNKQQATILILVETRNVALATGIQEIEGKVL